MSGIGGFKGVSADQDARFSNKQKKLMKSMKFPKELDLKVDPTKVNWVVMAEWVAKRVTELLGVEDEVLIQFIHNKLQEKKMPEAKELHIDLIPFLEKNTSLFMKELWALLASASSTASGIPQEILDSKAEELRKRKELQEKNEELRLQRKRDREGEQDVAPVPEDRAKDSFTYDQGNRNRWDRGRNDGGHWRSRDHRGRGGRFHGGRRYAPHIRERPRSRGSRSPRRRSRSPPRKSTRGIPKASTTKFLQPRTRSPYRKGSRSPERHSPRKENIRQSKRYGSTSPPKYHGKSRQQSPLEKKSREPEGVPRYQDLREASPGRSTGSGSQPRSEHASRNPIKESGTHPKKLPILSNQDALIDQEEKANSEVDKAPELNSGSKTPKDKDPMPGQTPNKSPTNSGSLRSPSPKSRGSSDHSPDRAKQVGSRPSLNSSTSSKGRSASPRKRGPYKPRSPHTRYQSPRWRQNGRESNRFAPRPYDHRRDVASRRRDFAPGSRIGYGRPVPSFDRSQRRPDSEYDYRPRNMLRGRGASSGGHFDNRLRQGGYEERGMGASQKGTFKADQNYWRGSRVQSPMRERRTGYAYRGASPQALKSRVQVLDKSQSPSRPLGGSYGEDLELEKAKSSAQADNARRSTLERNTSDLGGESSGGEVGLKRGKKRKKEKKSKSKKHKKHKDSKKHKKTKIHKPETPSSSNDMSDKISNEKRIEDLRKKALESMGMSSA